MQKLLVLFLVALMILAACGGHTTVPTITTEVTVSHLTDEEYNRVGTHGIDNPSKEDFRKFSLKFVMPYRDKLSNRQFDFPGDWRDIINSIDDEDRYWYGSGGHELENKNRGAVYFKDFVFYARGLSDDDIVDAFDSAVVYASWDTNSGEEEQMEHVVGELIEFE
ncbi:hypothetical protein [Alkalibacillus haloalkaliphilus]|uniref:hypothetical protein n=1 Tax=Alkalibacillus haloalkaliphilus TaxID=94136 RepID=UPI0029357783|nr:hypothetical protein [Alkalibacillus haloalkaliphilus]MDV2583324.1 hypothetical protein [Alkalibacillus haloalkaliphilus]